MKTFGMAAIAVTLTFLSGFDAAAAEKDRASTEGAKAALPAQSNALELSVGAGYEQGFGNVTDQTKLTDLGQAGGAVHVGVGYRVIPRLTLGISGGAAKYASPSSDVPRDYSSYAAGVKADWHFNPADEVLDPWVSFGVGWRGYVESQGQRTGSMHGMDIAKVEVGVDYRLTPGVAVSPVLGVDLTTFFTVSDGTRAFQNIQNAGLTAFLFAGVEGRFDVPLGKEAAPEVARR